MQIRRMGVSVYISALLSACSALAETSKPDRGLPSAANGIAAAEPHEAVLVDPLKLDFGKIIFVKRFTYNSNHYYTDFINSRFMPGGNLCLLDVKSGQVKELVPELKGGVFERFDLSFDATKVVFAWKADANVGHRIYEVNIDGTGLRQLTFPQADEADLVKKYGARDTRAYYHHGTDDMQPCYLPDGGIVFISTRCQFGILCNDPDVFTTTVLYRMDGDGKNLCKLSNSSLSEASPAIRPDGRILYTRWEYVDKGASAIKCLWSMNPDGSASSEVYGNDIATPATLIYGRPIPGDPSGYVVLGTPHYPQNAVGTVIRLDTTRNIRTREPMSYITPCVDIRGEGGFEFRDASGSWVKDYTGKGPLFKDPYPLSKNLFLVSHKPDGPIWQDPKAYGLYLLDDKGRVQLIYKDPAISCWMPYPVRTRAVPPVLLRRLNSKLAQANQAQCVVADIYYGLENVPRGTVKYLRVLEQVPRPWAARRTWKGQYYDHLGATGKMFRSLDVNADDTFGQQYTVISLNTHIALKVQHGLVPVEEDGSASFLVPADANIFFQALDENHMAVQTERTFVNYRPGEIRSCVGCHETPNDASSLSSTQVKKALLRPPSEPGPQPGELAGQRPLHYPTDVQPVWDRHCVSCHSGTVPKGKLDLSGTMTEFFSVSYEHLLQLQHRHLLGPIISEIGSKMGNASYLPALSLGSRTSVLAAMLSKGKVQLADPQQAERARKLIEVHKDINISREERLKVTNWIDTNCQYYGSYWGRRNLHYKDHPDFRPVPTFEAARSMTPIIQKGQP